MLKSTNDQTVGARLPNLSSVKVLKWSTALLTATPATGVTRAKGNTVWTAPLFDDDVMIRVPVEAFGRTLYFLVDTGFTVSALDTQFRTQLGKPVSVSPVEDPLGTGRNLPIYAAPDLSLARISCLDLTMARKISGQPCDGILGMDFFAGTS